MSYPTAKIDGCLRIVDTLWSCFVIHPLVVFYWSGTWKLLDTYILPENSLGSAYISLGIGTAVGLSGYFVLPVLSEHVNPEWSAKHVLISRLFSYIYAFGMLNFWRGVWNVTDHFVGIALKWSLLSYGISTLLLIMLRSATSCLGSPYIVTKDHRDDFYKAYTLFRSEPDTVCRYLLDSVLSHIGVTQLTIHVWRALWNTLTHIKLSNEKLLTSYFVSLGAGYGSCIVLFLLQHPLYLLARRLRTNHWFLEYALEVFVKLASTVACVLLWRGAWGLCRDFILKDTWQFWLAHGLGIVALLAVQASGTIGIPSVAVDCEFGWGTGQYYPIDFFLQWYYKRRYLKLSIQSDENETDKECDDDDLLSG